jgi:hypothetical protein
MNSKNKGNKTTIKKIKQSYIKDGNSNTLKRSDKRKLTPTY